MAGTLTHAYFILDVYDLLDIKTKEFLIDQKELLKTSAQNMDVLYFYNILNIKKGKRIREFGHYFHSNQTLNFFETMINYIKYNGYGYHPEVMAFLYGMISHYILDSTLHPYVIYKTGIFDPKNKDTYKYNQKHDELENFFDNYLVKTKEGILPWKFPCHEFCFNVENFSDTLTEVINFTYKEVFGIQNMSKFYFKAIVQMKNFYRLFRYDPLKIKNKAAKVFDFITPKSIVKIDVVSYYMKVKPSLHYLNLDHKTWYYPTDKRTKSKKSMIEIYSVSIKRTIEVINEINGYIYDNKKLNFKKVIKNNSYLSGKDCDKNKELKYFEF